RRGDSTTPVWLDIMEKNPNTSLERFIPRMIARIGTIKMEPYVDYLRTMFRTRRPEEIRGYACEQALAIFFVYGTSEDVQLVQELAKKRPFLAPFVQMAFEREQRRTAPRAGPSEPEADRAPNRASEPAAPWKSGQ